MRILGFACLTLLFFSCSEQRKFHSLHDEVVQMKETTSDVNDTANEALDVVEVTGDQVEAAAAQVEAIRVEANDLKTKFDTLMTTFDELSVSLKNVDKNSSGIDEMKDHVATVVGHAGEISAQAATIQNTLLSVKSEIVDLKTEFSATAQKMDRMTIEATNLLTRFSDVLDNVDKIGESLDATTNAIQTMQQTMSRVEAYIAQMTESMGYLYSDMRQGDALNNRAFRWNEMEEDTALSGKYMKAINFFAALEFQLWKGFGDDSVSKLNRLYRDALAEFFLMATKYQGTIQAGPKPPTSSHGIVKEDNSLMNLYALSLAIDIINPNADDNIEELRKKGARYFSVLDLLEVGLMKRFEEKKGISSTANAEEFIQLIVHRDDISLYMMRLRYAALVSTIVDTLTGLASKSMIEQANFFNPNQPWKITKIDSNADVNFAITWVQKALRIKKFMDSIEEKVKLPTVYLNQGSEFITVGHMGYHLLAAMDLDSLYKIKGLDSNLRNKLGSLLNELVTPYIDKEKNKPTWSAEQADSFLFLSRENICSFSTVACSLVN